VATFLGEVNRMPALVRGGRAETAIGVVPARDLPDGPAELLLRPEGLLIRPAEEGTAAVVQACRLLGATTLVHLAVPDGAGGVLHLPARLPPSAALSRGQQVGVVMDPARAFVFRAVQA